MRHQINDAVFDSDVGTIQLADNSIIQVEPLLMDQHRNGLSLMDANGLVFFSRQLTLIKARTYDTKYAELKARMLFPVNNEGGPGIQQIETRSFDQSGQARIINGYSDDLPRADVSSNGSTFSPVRSLGVSYGYSHDELQAAIHASMPLDARKAMAANRAVEQEINDIAFYGNASAGLTGFFSNPNIANGQVRISNSGVSTNWADKTSEEIIFDVNDGFADIFVNTAMVERPNTLVLPPDKYSFIMSHPRSTTSDTTIAQFLVNNSPYLNSMADIIALNEASAAFNPELTEDAMILYKRDPETMELEIPVEVEHFPVQMRNLEYVIPCRARVGGLVIRYPAAVSVLTGI